MKLAELTGKKVPEEINIQRARLVDAMQDSYPYMHGKKFAIYGDPNFLIGRDTGTPLIRIGFPIFDRHHLHRYSISGYKGALNLLTWITNAVLDQLDEETKGIAQTDYFFDCVR